MLRFILMSVFIFIKHVDKNKNLQTYYLLVEYRLVRTAIGYVEKIRDSNDFEKKRGSNEPETDAFSCSCL